MKIKDEFRVNAYKLFLFYPAMNSFWMCRSPNLKKSIEITGGNLDNFMEDASH